MATVHPIDNRKQSSYTLPLSQNNTSKPSAPRTSKNPTVIPTLFVDDLSIELSGEQDHILFHITGFTEKTTQRIHTDGMEVSATKSVVSASHPTPGDAQLKKLDNKSIPCTLRVHDRVFALHACKLKSV